MAPDCLTDSACSLVLTKAKTATEDLRVELAIKLWKNVPPLLGDIESDREAYPDSAEAERWARTSIRRLR